MALRDHSAVKVWGGRVSELSAPMEQGVSARDRHAVCSWVVVSGDGLGEECWVEYVVCVWGLV